MSGLSRTPGKRVWANPHRGFESRPLRQMQKTLVSQALTRVFLFWVVAELVAPHVSVPAHLQARFQLLSAHPYQRQAGQAFAQNELSTDSYHPCHSSTQWPNDAQEARPKQPQHV